MAGSYSFKFRYEKFGSGEWTPISLWFFPSRSTVLKCFMEKRRGGSSIVGVGSLREGVVCLRYWTLVVFIYWLPCLLRESEWIVECDFGQYKLMFWTRIPSRSSGLLNFSRFPLFSGALLSCPVLRRSFAFLFSFQMEVYPSSDVSFFGISVRAINHRRRAIFS